MTEYVDPTQPDPRFPDRPTHPDFHRLSSIVQENDRIAEQDGDPSLGCDLDSFLYLAKNRVDMFAAEVGRRLSMADLMALYADAFALGRAFGEIPSMQRLSFTPDAIREHFDGDEPDPTEGLSDDQLIEVAELALTSDLLYETFHAVLVASLAEVGNQGAYDPHGGEKHRFYEEN